MGCNHNHVHKAALSSVFAALFLTVLKISVGIFTNSVGILAEAAHSAIDLIAAFVTFWAVKLSARPADDDHHFGHAKIENIAALFETFLLWVTCVWITKEAVFRLLGFDEGELRAGIWGVAVLVVSIVVDVIRSRELQKVAEEHNSQALAADALHFQTDALSSAAVLIGFSISYFAGFVWADAIAALGVVVWTIATSIKLAKESIDQLMDKAPTGSEEKTMLLLQEIADIQVISSIKIRQAGPSIFFDLTIGLDRNMTFERAHLITDEVEEKIKANFKNAIVTVHPEPF